MSTRSQPPTETRSGGLAHAGWLVIVPFAVLVLAILFLVTSGDLIGREANYPRVLAIAVAVLALASMRGDFVQGRREESAARPAAEDPDEGDDDEDLEGRRGVGVAVWRVLVFVAVNSLSIYLMSWLGFFIPAALLVGGGLIVLGVRSWWRVIAYTLGLVVAAHLLFVEALRVPFPPAPWS